MTPHEHLAAIVRQRQAVVEDVVGHLRALTGLPEAIRDGRLNHAIAVTRQIGRELRLLKKAEAVIEEERARLLIPVSRPSREHLGKDPVRSMAIFHLIIVAGETANSVGGHFGISACRAGQIACNVARYEFKLRSYRLRALREEFRHERQTPAPEAGRCAA